MSDNHKENINLHALLETYSIEEISELFTEIDKKIVSLHQVSSEDFLRLNRDFKKFHRQANQISENASYLFDYITGHENNELIEDIDKFYKRLKSQSELFNSHIELVSDLINRLLSKLRQSFFPIKNFKQNLTSLKFLESNLELNVTLSEQSGSPSVQGTCDELREEVSQIEKLFARLKQLLKDEFLLSKQFNAEKVDINKILDLLKEEIEVYSNHYRSAKEKLPEIKEKTDATSDSINKIITNLQYQDIIKQKMEHIQKTHKELAEELNNFKSENQTTLNEKVKYFIRLRDIAGLQAAQLMHTNKEYQTAIQKISDKFLEIGENMTMVSKQCADYTSFDSEKQKIFFNSLKKNLNQAEDHIQHFCRFNINFRKNVDDIVDLLNQILYRYEKVQPLMDDLERRLKDPSWQDQENEANRSIIRQMNQVFDDLKANGNIMADLFEAYRNHREKLNKDVISTMSKTKVTDCENFPDKISHYLSNLSEMESKIVDKLQENNEMSDKVFKEVQHSVNQIQYYEYFEKEIEAIIDELNALNFNLKNNSEEDVADRKENLEKLKAHYTMNTEFDIHDQVTNGGDVNMENVEEDEEEGGDLELF
ncbi:MAG: hypothetical protein ACLFM7_04420 [Bacteroidales bacterium]